MSTKKALTAGSDFVFTHLLAIPCLLGCIIFQLGEPAEAEGMENALPAPASIGNSVIPDEYWGKYQSFLERSVAIARIATGTDANREEINEFADNIRTIANKIESELRAIENPVTHVQSTNTRSTWAEIMGYKVIVIGNFNFEANSDPQACSVLTPEIQRQLSAVALILESLEENEHAIEAIRGYADLEPLKNPMVYGNDDGLASARAKNACDYLNRVMKTTINEQSLVQCGSKNDRFGGIETNHRCVIIVLRPLKSQ